jgi:predicted RNA-binding Zn-ribbon protein involved in translation (DUF1610 family)
MKLTNTFTGADASRLSDCIQYAAANDLKITEHTQAGINQNSGNVFLWDEDWPACIYVGLGDSKATMSWSCPNCGEEVDCDKGDAEDLNEYYNSHDACTHCLDKSSGHNE